MNWTAVVIVLIGLGVVIVGAKGNQDNFMAAVLGHSYKDSTLT